MLLGGKTIVRAPIPWIAPYKEALPQKPYPLPQLAPHLLSNLTKKHLGKRLITTLGFRLQKQINTLVKRNYENYKQNEVYNMAILVMDVHAREVKSYVGNTPTTKQHQKDVDIISSGRSAGSILKPLLYATMWIKTNYFQNN